MTEQELTNRYIAYIRDQMRERAYDLYPSSRVNQLLYQVGFLEAQLARAMLADSHVQARFRSSVEQATARDRQQL